MIQRSTVFGLTTRFALAGSAVALVLAVVEIAIRGLGLAPDYKFYPGPFIPDERYDYKLQPGYRGSQGPITVTINSNGLRGTSFGPLKNERRILVLGDSLAFGWGVADEEAFPALLEQRLTADGLNVKVINGGVPGYSTWHQFKFLAARIKELQPDLVLLALFGNDYLDREWVVNSRGTLTKRGMENLRSNTVEILFNNPFLSRHWATYRLIKNAVRNLLYEEFDRPLRASLLDLVVPSAEAADKPAATGWERCYENLDQIRALLSPRAIPLIILDLTEREDVFRELTRRGYRVTRYIESDRPGCTLPRDGHPNAEGHRRISEHAYAVVRERIPPNKEIQP
jgi:lysophospholipase L1-like esterase